MPKLFFIAPLIFFTASLCVQAQNYDTLATDKARIIAGKSPKSYLRSLTEKPLFKQHQNEVEKWWAYVQRHDIKAIKNWQANNQVLSSPGINTLFYPFSGPDFLYAYTFFPKASRYIMGGLEDCGTLPKYAKMDDDALKEYLHAVRRTFRYMNRVGYFVTKHMLKDFKSGHLNGTIHIIAYYLIRTNHCIKSIRYFHLNNTGSKVYHSPDNTDYHKIRGMEIKFMQKSGSQVHTIDYFSMDLSNENLRVNPQFLKYVDAFRGFGVFLKSASYLLHNGDFSTIRDTLLQQSRLILQDPTGIPYKLLKRQKDKKLKLYGSYSKPISDFDYRFQPSLKSDLKAHNAKDLPFRIGYGSWNDETALMLSYRQSVELPEKEKQPVVAKKTEPPPVKTAAEKADREVIFKVQFYMSQYRKSPEADRFKELPEIDYYTQGSVFKYTTGRFRDYEKCRRHLQKVRQKGFSDAFVVAFRKGKRISVDNALKIVRND